MKNLLLLMLITSAAISGAQDNLTANAPENSSAERNMAAAQEMIQKNPTQHSGYDLLAMALVRRVRETSDNRYYAQAEDAVNKSLQLEPNNFDARKIRVSILLGRDEFPAALAAAIALNKQVPDDVTVYGFLAEANSELGNYKEAENAAQWMLDLRPGNLPALTHAARLRELFGDNDGSYELLQMAYQSTAPTESEERSWLLTQMGRIRLAAGKTDEAERLVQQALTTFPNYPFAEETMAGVRESQLRYDQALDLFRQRCKKLSSSENLFRLARALRLAGQEEEARRVFSDFETEALVASSHKDNANRDLIFYYADYVKQPTKALKVAEEEYGWRKDIYTLDAYGWALHVNGRDVEARKQVETALAVGIQDANLFLHAGEISLTLGDSVSARKYFEKSADLNTAESQQARLALGELKLPRNR